MFPNDNLLIFGEGTQKEKLRALTKAYHMEERVFFMGESSTIEEEIKDAKVFVLSSNYEGLPNVVMEAMALGLPIISTDCPCGGPRMLIDHNNSGILVEPNNLEDMVRGMVTLLRDPSFGESLGNNAKTASYEFKPEKIYKAWEGYMKQIIDKDKL